MTKLTKLVGIIGISVAILVLAGCGGGSGGGHASPTNPSPAVDPEPTVDPTPPTETNTLRTVTIYHNMDEDMCEGMAKEGYNGFYYISIDIEPNHVRCEDYGFSNVTESPGGRISAPNSTNSCTETYNDHGDMYDSGDLACVMYMEMDQ